MAHADRGLARPRRARVERAGARVAGGLPRGHRGARRRRTSTSTTKRRSVRSTTCASCASCCSSTRARRRYGAPEYGGNRDVAGWRAIRYAGDVQPRGWTRRGGHRCLTSTWSSSGRDRAARPPPTCSPRRGGRCACSRRAATTCSRSSRRSRALGHLSNDEVKFDRRHFLGPDPLLEPRTLPAHRGRREREQRRRREQHAVDGRRRGLPRRRQAAARTARSTSGSRASSGPVDGADVADWPVDYDEMEPYYAEAERLIGVAGDHTGNPFAAWRSAPVPDAAGRRHVRRHAHRPRRRRASATTRTARRRAPTASRTTAARRATTAGSARSTGARSRPRATRSGMLRSALRTGRCEIRPESVAVDDRSVDASAVPRPTGVRYLDADGEAQVVTARRGGGGVRRVRDAPVAAAQRHRQLVRPRRPLPDVPPADDRARLLPVPAARVQGPRRDPPHGRPDRRRRRVGGRRAAARAAVPAGRHRRARRQRAPDHRGDATCRRGRSTARSMADSPMRDRMAAFTMQGEDLPQATNRVDLDPDGARRVGHARRAGSRTRRTRTTSRARTTGRPASKR